MFEDKKHASQHEPHVYVDEMRHLSLLSQEDELSLAHEIEQGYMDILFIFAQYPGLVTIIKDAFLKVEQGKGTIDDVLFDVVSNQDVIEFETSEKRIEYKMVQKRFHELFELTHKARANLDSLGRHDKYTQISLNRLHQCLCSFKFVPQFIENCINFIEQLPAEEASRHYLALERMQDVKKILFKALSSIKRAKESFFNAKLRLVFSVAKKYIDCGVPYSDLVQAGNRGLKKAIDRYDYRLDYPFSSHATWWIRQSILSLLKQVDECILAEAVLGEKYNKSTSGKDVLSRSYDISVKDLSQITGQVFSSLTESQANALRLHLGIDLNDETINRVSGTEDGTNVSKKYLHWIQTEALRKLKEKII